MDESWRVAVVAEAMTWLRTRWQHRCRVKGAGVDCGQFIAACFVNTGLVSEVVVDKYPRDWMLNKSDELFLGVVRRYLVQITSEPLPGDVAVWKYGRGFSHGAVVAGWPTVIHATLSARQVCLADASKGELMYNKDGSIRDVLFFSLPPRG